MISVFADYAGDIKNNSERVVVLATLTASDTQVEQIKTSCDHLRNRVREWGVDTSHERFEFKGYDIVQGSGIWRELSGDKRIEVGRALKRTIRDSGLYFAMVLISKDDGGLKGIAEFSRLVDSIREDAMATMSEEKKHDVELLNARLPKKGLGPLGNMAGLLFGLTTGLMHSKGLRDSAKLTIDDQFVRQIEVWELIFQIQEISWPLVAALGLFPRWPKNSQPGWHLGNTLDEVNSCDSYGVQLADFIAYTTRRINEKPSSLADQLSIVDDCPPIRLADHPGIYLITSHKPQRRHTYPRKKRRRK